MRLCSSCGKYKDESEFVIRRALKSGLSRECKPCHRERNRTYKSTNGFIRDAYSRARYRARKRGIEFSISPEDLDSLWKQQDGRCAVTGLKMSKAVGIGGNGNDFRGSLDRINPEKGYVSGNVRWVCWFVNQMKNDRHDALLLFHAKAIVDGLSNNTASSIESHLA